MPRGRRHGFDGIGALPDHLESRDREALKFKEVEHVLIEKVEQLFRDML
ncbi:MAG: hypothetical protein ACRECP_12405 [Methylocella sp.]